KTKFAAGGLEPAAGELACGKLQAKLTFQAVPAPPVTRICELGCALGVHVGTCASLLVPGNVGAFG
ncbi:MAG TPA: hypothetical protein VMI93_14955, partial [Candidatus Solibacter sp.]|nr:hypothetical protein [Candidatus Solibacter sp.]